MFFVSGTGMARRCLRSPRRSGKCERRHARGGAVRANPGLDHRLWLPGIGYRIQKVSPYKNHKHHLTLKTLSKSYSESMKLLASLLSVLGALILMGNAASAQDKSRTLRLPMRADSKLWLEG